MGVQRTETGCRAIHDCPEILVISGVLCQRLYYLVASWKVQGAQCRNPSGYSVFSNDNSGSRLGIDIGIERLHSVTRFIVERTLAEQARVACLKGTISGYDVCLSGELPGKAE